MQRGRRLGLLRGLVSRACPDVSVRALERAPVHRGPVSKMLLEATRTGVFFPAVRAVMDAGDEVRHGGTLDVAADIALGLLLDDRARSNRLPRG